MDEPKGTTRTRVENDLGGGLYLAWLALLVYAGVLLHAYARIPLALLPVAVLVGLFFLFLLFRAIGRFTEDVLSRPDPEETGGEHAMSLEEPPGIDGGERTGGARGGRR